MASGPFINGGEINMAILAFFASRLRNPAVLGFPRSERNLLFRVLGLLHDTTSLQERSSCRKFHF
jgi:hypothetical protein